MKKITFLFIAILFSSLSIFSQPVWQPSGASTVFTNRNVGIKTDSPTAAIDINGRSRTRGNATFDSAMTALSVFAQNATFAVAVITGNFSAAAVSTATINAMNGSLAVDVNSRKLYNSSGNMKVDWENGQLWNAVGPPPSSSMISIDWSQRKLFNSLGNVKVDWEQGFLYNAAPGNVVSLKWLSRELMGFDGFTTSLNWGSRTLSGGQWQYDADYSSSYNSRSLVDKQYVDTKVASVPATQWTTNPNGSLSFSGDVTVNNLNALQSINIGSFSFTNGGNQNPPNITDSIATPYAIALYSGANDIRFASDNVQVGSFANFTTAPFTGNGQLNLNGSLNATGNINSTSLNSTSIQTQQLNIGSGPGTIDFNPGRIAVPNTFSGAVMYVGMMDSTSSQQEVCTHNGDLLLQSHTGLQGNTLINADNTGFVGIGTSTPTEKLSVQGNSFVSGNMRVGSLAGNGDRQLIVDSNGNLKTGGPDPQAYYPYWRTDGNPVLSNPTHFLGTTDAADLVIKTNSEERMRITATGNHPGNVGIGTATPEKKLHVVTSHTTCATCSQQTHQGIRLEEHTFFSDLNSTTSSIWDIQPFGAGFAISRPNESPKMVITSGGNVGIGTNSPSAKLHVEGNIKADGISVTNGKIQASAFASTSPLVFEAPINTERARIDDVTGNFGIGTTTPQYKLDVSGAVNASQFLVNGVPLATGEWQLNGNDIYNTNFGKVGIGITTPQATLDVNGNFKVGNSQGYIQMGYNGFNTTIDDYSPNTGLLINYNSKNHVTIGSKLTVCGEVRCNKIRVETFTCDFVFDKNYQLITLAERKEKVLKNKHLINVAPAKEMEANGNDLGNTTMGILQNVEEHELYLYKHDEKIISLEMENEKLKQSLELLQKKIDALTMKIESLQK